MHRVWLMRQKETSQRRLGETERAPEQSVVKPVACASYLAWMRFLTFNGSETCAHSVSSTVRIFTCPCKGLSMSDQDTIQRTVLPIPDQPPPRPPHYDAK